MLHRVPLAYVPDLLLLPTCVLHHDLRWFRGNVQGASLHHAPWIHEPPRADE